MTDGVTTYLYITSQANFAWLDVDCSALHCFFASLSAFRRALLRISSCMALFLSTKNLDLSPMNVDKNQCIKPWLQYGVLVNAMP